MLRTGSPAILKQRLKLIPFTHVNFSPNLISCASASLVQVKKMFNPYLPWFQKNKAYRPNAHLLDTLMHLNINII